MNERACQIKSQSQFQHIYQRTGSIPITDQNITSISSYDLKAATAAVVNSNLSNRPAYGALATGTHELQRKAAWKSIIEAQEMIRQGQLSGDYQAVAAGTLAYNNALKKYHTALNAQQAAAKQLGVLNGGQIQNDHMQQPIFQKEYSISGRESPISLNGHHLGAIGSSHQRTVSPQQQMFNQLELISGGGASSAPNSTRGSSPSVPPPVNGSQGSLHNSNSNQYKTWSNSSMTSSVNDNLDSDKFRNSLNALIGMFSNCGMNSGNSSCDEGLGPSPTSS